MPHFAVFASFAFNNFRLRFPNCTLNPITEFSEPVLGDEAAEREMSEMYTNQQSYLELIKDRTPTPPLLEYQVRCGQVETNIYEEPIQELIIEPDTKESTPEYQAVPVKSLISTFEQGKSLSKLFNFSVASNFYEQHEQKKFYDFEVLNLEFQSQHVASINFQLLDLRFL